IVGGSIQNLQGHRVTVYRGGIYQRSERGDARTRPRGAVELMQCLVGAAGPGSFEQRLAQRRRRAPAFFHAERGTGSLAGEIEGAGLVTENVPPTPRARGASGGVAPEGDGSGAGYDDNSLPYGGSSGKRNRGVVRDQQPAGAQHAGQDGLLIVRASAHAETGGAEDHGSGVQANLAAGSAEAFPDGSLEFRTALGR